MNKVIKESELFTNPHICNPLFGLNKKVNKVESIKIINKFISSTNPDTNIIKKRKYYIYKFYIDVDLVFVYGSFNEYKENEYEFILKNNFFDYDDDFKSIHI